MNKRDSKNKKLKPLKNIDLVHKSQQLKAFCLTLPPLGLLGFVKFGIVGLIIAPILSLSISLISVAVSERLGGIATKLYVGRKPRWNLQERFSADLTCARVQKMNKKYDDAIIIVENILAQQPDFNEALLLKAQILSGGFNENHGAKKCLIKILQSEPRNSPIHSWTKSFYKELVEKHDSFL